MRVDVDYGLCEANGVCMGINPEVFELDDDDHLTVLKPQVAPEAEASVVDAVRQCPRQALTITE
ncbi:ferredoxin [Mycobacterium sp. DL440]|uniref:ferredoxin n=1 Tax=Mycobacterium sp. DL440 TaxID=2675523 RepID=UPI00141DE321|nr:ferredoxin [Mycobacterium sp. DL440]